MPRDLEGKRLTRQARSARHEPASARGNRFYRALLEEPVAVALQGPKVQAGPSLRLEGVEAPVLLADSPELGGPTVALFASTGPLCAEAQRRGLWSDGVERFHVFEPGSLFPLLRGHPGATLMLGYEETLALDAGEVAALAAGMTPVDVWEMLVRLVGQGEGREAAHQLSERMLYVLGHPDGGLVMVEREIPVFLHLDDARRGAERLGARLGRRPAEASISARELLRSAARGKLSLALWRGHQSLRLEPVDLR